MTWTENLILFLRTFLFIFFQFFHHLFELSLWAFVSLIYGLNLLFEAFQEILELWLWCLSNADFSFILELATLVFISVIYKIVYYILHWIQHGKMIDIEITNLEVLGVIFILNLPQKLYLAFSHLHFINIILYVLTLDAFFNYFISSTLGHQCWSICSLRICKYILLILWISLV